MPHSRGMLNATTENLSRLLKVSRSKCAPEQLLDAVGGYAGLGRASLADLEPIVGKGAASTLFAAIDLGRAVTGSAPERGKCLGNAADVWTSYRARLANLDHEEFWVCLLDIRHRVVAEYLGGKGSLSGVEVNPRDIFRDALKHGRVARVIFVHNHPSGDASPSREDIQLTNRLRQVGELVDIQVLDHVIVASGGFTSLADRGWL
jgi:DNA repair protein RadC